MKKLKTKTLLAVLALLLLPLVAAAQTAQPSDTTGAKGAYTPFTSTRATFNSLSDTVTLTLSGRQGVAVQFVTSDLEADVTIDCSADSGVTYDADACQFIGTTQKLAGQTTSVGSGSFIQRIFIGPGITTVRLTVSAYTSGTGTAILTATQEAATILPTIIDIESNTPLEVIFPAPPEVEVTVSALPTGAATEAKQDDEITELQAIGGILPGYGPAGTPEANTTSVQGISGMTPLDVQGPLTDTELRATAVNVIVDSSELPSGASTLAEQQTQTASLSVLDDWDDGADHVRVVGAVADDAAISGNPVTIGGQARKGRRTVVSAEDDAVRASFDMYGRPMVIGVGLTRAVLQATASGDTAIVSAPGSGSKIRLYRAEFGNNHASVAVTAGLKFASGTAFGKRYLPALGGQAVIALGSNYTEGGDNEALNVNLSAGSTTVEVTVYYEIVVF